MNGYFWCGGADGVLHIMKCGDCSLYFHPYQSCCSACLSANVAPAPVSGRGTVLSSTINHQPWFPHVPVPYIVVLRSEEHTSELQSLMRISYAVFCLKKKKR